MPSTPNKNCSLAHGLSTGYPRWARWSEVTKWMHLNAAIDFAITRPESKLSDIQFADYQLTAKPDEPPQIPRPPVKP
jgi:hypothetical protein